jgi:hypothetical protein
MELSPSVEAASRSATQEFSNIYYINVHYRVHKSPPLLPSQGKVNPVHTNPSYKMMMMMMMMIIIIIIIIIWARGSVVVEAHADSGHGVINQRL